VVTVVTAVFNGAADIDRTIDSVLAQTYRDVEYIVIDGASNDGTQDIVRTYGDAVSVFISEPDRGVYEAMNRGIALARGDYLVFMNCGDEFVCPGALASAMAFASPSRLEALFGGWLRRRADGRHESRTPRLSEGIFNHQAVIYSRALHQLYGPYAVTPGFTTADYLFFSQLIASGAVVIKAIDVPIALIDVHGMSAGPQTLSQKVAIDFLHGRSGRGLLIAVLALHPLLLRMRRLLGANKT
jgi:glycosyltransferase involved in cell wall biosynthesis